MLFSAVASTTSPIQFGPYLLTECVGQGGMAVVYKATRHGPSGFTKTVVVKAMLPALSSQREFVAMFSGEARLMAQLTHPNIVQVHDFGVVDGIPYLAMEYLPGRNLSQLRAAVAARGEKMPVGCALAIARDVCHGLGYAHEFTDGDGQRRQIIHRDVSPSNVMVCRDGTVKLLDFGVAKIVGEFDYDVTQSFKGKYGYMSPEQVNHQPIDKRVDVFAVGIVLHELLTGKRLFAAQTELETLQRVSAAKVIAPSVDNPDVPRALDAIVKKALAKDPGERYASGSALAEALESLDALAWSRRRLAAFVAELFANDWMVVCDVCGKQVLPGGECGECGTAAPETDAPVALDPEAEARARSARQALQPLLDAGHTDKTELPAEQALPALPAAGGSEPLPLPPPPLASRRAARAKLSVVHTPLPPRMAPPPPVVPAADDRTDETPVPPQFDEERQRAQKTGEFEIPSVAQVDPSLLPPPGPPRLYVVPPPEPTPIALPGVAFPSPLATPRPAGPQPLFAVPSTGSVQIPRQPRLVWYTTAAAAIGLCALGVALLVSHPAPKDPPQAPAMNAPVEAPIATPPIATPPIATPPVVAAPVAAPLAKLPKPPLVAPSVPKPVAAPVAHVRRHVARPHVQAAPSTPAEPERTVKEGRIVDPFAGLK